jgi:hypothetical protein
MPFLRLSDFSGVMPKIDPSMLPDNNAQVASNLRLETGVIKPWRTPRKEQDSYSSSPKTIYKYQGPVGTRAVWITWDTDVNVVPGPVADLEEGRIYYTGGKAFSPRKANWAMITTNGSNIPPYPNTYYELGVPAPKSEPLLQAAGTGEPPQETRAYIYTLVTTFGAVLEESAPSPPAYVTCNYADDPVTVSGFEPTPTGAYNFTHRRIYRSVTGGSSVNYQLVAEIPVSVSSFVDDLPVQSLGLSLQSAYYTPPPAELHGLVSMPNGMLAGFVGNQVWFCEPFIPHAWPAIYMQTTEFPIVGLGVFGNSLLVATEKYPYIMTGSTPSAIQSDKLPLPEPCVSKRSIVSDQFGVVYASPNGLVAISTGLQRVITEQMYMRQQWQALNPHTMLGVVYNSMYIGFYEATDGTRKAVVMHRTDNPPLSDYDCPAQAAYVDQVTGALYIVDPKTAAIVQLDAGTEPEREYVWKSKKFIMPHPMNFAVMQVLADYKATSEKGLTLTVHGYADGKEVFRFNPTSIEPTRLPAGFKAYEWEVMVTGTRPLLRAVMSTSVLELKDVP